MSNFTTVVDKSVGDAFSELMWDTYIKDNFNKGVNRPIADSILAAPAATFDFTSIDQNFAHLKLVLYLRDTGAAGNIAPILRANGDGTNNYSWARLRSDGTTATPENSGGAVASATVFRYVGTTIDGNTFTAVEILIPHYSQAVNYKQLLATYGTVETNAVWEHGSGIGRYAGSTAAISRLTLTAGNTSFATGSRATLYGYAF